MLVLIVMIFRDYPGCILSSNELMLTAQTVSTKLTPCQLVGCHLNQPHSTDVKLMCNGIILQLAQCFFLKHFSQEISNIHFAGNFVFSINNHNVAQPYQSHAKVNSFNIYTFYTGFEFSLQLKKKKKKRKHYLTKRGECVTSVCSQHHANWLFVC